MDRRLIDVCQSGNVSALYALLEDEPSVLELIDEIPFTRTPLHLAIIAQKPDFAREITRVKPSFVYKFDRYGYSPIHLAAEKGQVKIINDLLEKNPSLATLVMGEQKLTPLHCAVVAGNVQVINLLLDSHPQCIFDLTVRKETAFHLAVKNRQVGAFLALIEVIKRMNESDVENSILSWRDEEGNTVFHLAALLKQEQVIEALSSIVNSQPGIQLNALIQNPEKEDKTDSQNKEENLSKLEEIGGKLRQISIPIPPSLASKPLKQESSTNLNHTGPPINRRVVIFALITGITCFLTAIVDPPRGKTSYGSGNSLLGSGSYLYFLFTLSNVMGFLLSLAIVVASAMASPYRKALLVILAAVVGAYTFTVFSNLPNAYQPIFGFVFLAVGGSASTIYITGWWEDYKEKVAAMAGSIYDCTREKKIQGSNLSAESYKLLVSSGVGFQG